MIFIIKVTTNKEDRALELISYKVQKKNLQIHSISRPHGLRGYIFLEAEDRDSAEEAAYNLPYVKGIIGKTVTYEEIKNMLEPVMEEINIEKGDIVEIIGELFKKEKAKVIRIDKLKGEAVVTLLAAVVPIPVTVKLDNIKVIRREKEETEEKEDDASESSRYSSNNNHSEQAGKNKVNESTKEFKGMKVPVELDFDEKTKEFEVKVSPPPTSELLKKELKLEKGTADHKKQKIGNASIEDIIKITKIKFPQMLEKDFKSAVKSILGTCASIGTLVESKEPKELLKDIEEGKFEKEINKQLTETAPEKRKELNNF